MRVANSPVVEDDASTHSSASGSSFCDDETSQCDGDVEQFVEVSSPKQIVKSKKNLVIKVVLAFFGVIVSLLLVDLILYFRMEFKVRTVDAVLNENNPTANVKMSLDVSSRLLFSSIKVDSLKCKAFHKAPYDTDEGQYFATVTNNNKFETNTMNKGFESIGDNNFIENMDILISDIDFDVMKRSIQDVYMTTEDTASRLDCSLNADINMLGIATVPAPTIHRKFEHKCEDCVTQREFSSTDIFMASVLGSLISEPNVESSREGEDNHKRSVFFSENSEEFVFNVHKLFDISGAFGDMTRFKVDVPSSEYVVASKDKEEFWSTTTTPFTVDLVADGGSVLKMDITTTCANVATNAACKVTDPADDFLDDVWNGDISYEMTSSARIAKDTAMGDRFKRFNAMRSAGHSTTSHDDMNDDDEYVEDFENFLESLFGFQINIDVDLSIGSIRDDISSIRDDMEVNVNRKLADELEPPGGAMDAGSAVVKLSGSDVKLIDMKLDWSSGWPGHEGGGFTSNVKLDFLDGEVTVDADINAGPDDMELVVRDFVMPSQDLKARDGFINATGIWHRDSAAREVSLDYTVNWSNEEQMDNTLTIAYGDILDNWNIDGLTMSGFTWSDVDAVSGPYSHPDDDTTAMPDGTAPMWDCKKLSHDAKGGSFVFCHSGKDDRLSFTYYDSDMKRVIKISGSTEGKMDFIDISDGPIAASEQFWTNLVSAEVMVKAQMTVYNDDFFRFATFETLRFHGMLNPQGFDLFFDVKDSRDQDVFLVRAMTGWKNLNSVSDMGITKTQFLVRTDDVDRFRLELAEAYVRYNEMDDMAVALDKFSLTMDGEKLVDATLKVSYRMDQIITLVVLKLQEEEIVYLKLEGMFDYDSSLMWNVDMKKILLRLNGEQRVKANMKGDMMEVDDSLNDMHMVMNMRGFLQIDKDELLRIQKMHGDVIADDNFKMISASSNIQGIIHGEDVINGTIFVDRMKSNWTISTNNFDVRLALVESSAPTSAPTVYPYATKTKVEVKTKIKFRTTKNSFENDENAKSASIKAFKKSLNQSKATVEIDEVKTEFIDTGARRRLAIVEGIEVTYKTTVIAESTGLSAAALATQMETSITTSVTEGSFSTNLAEAFEELDVTETFTSEDTVVVEAPVVTVVQDDPTSQPSAAPSAMPTEEPITPFPTHEPTPAPSAAPTSTHMPTSTSSPTSMPTRAPTVTPGVAGDSAFSTVNIIIIAVVVPVGLSIIAAVAFFMLKGKTKLSVTPASALPVGLQE